MPIRRLMSWFRRRRAKADGDEQATPPPVDGSLDPEPVVSVPAAHPPPSPRRRRPLVRRLLVRRPLDRRPLRRYLPPDPPHPRLPPGRRLPAGAAALPLTAALPPASVAPSPPAAPTPAAPSPVPVTSELSALESAVSGSATVVLERPVATLLLEPPPRAWRSRRRVRRSPALGGRSPPLLSPLPQTPSCSWSLPLAVWVAVLGVARAARWGALGTGAVGTGGGSGVGWGSPPPRCATPPTGSPRPRGPCAPGGASGRSSSTSASPTAPPSSRPSPRRARSASPPDRCWSSRGSCARTSSPVWSPNGSASNTSTSPPTSPTWARST